MKEAALYLKGLTLLGRIQYAQDIHTHMTGNAYFPTPNPTLAALQTTIDDAADALAAYSMTLEDLRMKLASRNTAIATMENTLRQLATYVSNTAAGSEVIILSSGMAVSQPPGPPPELVAPGDLRAFTNGFSGLIKLDWKTVRGARTYLIQRATALEGPWTQVSIVTGLRADVENLTPGSTYLFRVCAIGVTGVGPWSDVVVKMAV